MAIRHPNRTMGIQTSRCRGCGKMAGVPIPPEIAKLWEVLEYETTMVHAYWQVFTDLFMGSQEQMDLLDRSAGFFFLVVQDALATDIQLTISKLADPPKSVGKDNATIQHLLEDALKLDQTLKPKLEPLYENFKTASKPVRDLRHKVLAHLDLHTAIKTVSAPPDVTIKEVRAALDALAEFMNTLTTHFGETPTAYQQFGMRGAGPKELVAMLRTADEYLAMQKAGKIPWEETPAQAAPPE
jgi:hypothetical protein